MNAKVHIAENGTILSWSVGRVDVLAPYREAPKTADARGGLPLCVPMFSTQQREVFGSHLPLHGLLMYEDMGKVETITEGASWKKTLTFPARENYTWDWSCTLILTLTLTNRVVLEFADGIRALRGLVVLAVGYLLSLVSGVWATFA